MIDDGEGDDKIIAVPVEDPRWDKVKDLADINEYTTKEIQHFFETYKQIEKKEVKITGFENREAAEKAVEKSVKLYKEQYGNKK